MAAGEEAAAAARADFARHWQEEFPGEPAPRMELGSVRAMERELERCRRHLRRLQRALAEERFKVLYLEAALARAPPRPPALPRRRPPPAAPCGSSPEGGSDGSSGAEDASSAGGWRGDTALRVGARQRGWRPPVRQRGPAAPQPPCQLLTGCPRLHGQGCPVLSPQATFTCHIRGRHARVPPPCAVPYAVPARGRAPPATAQQRILQSPRDVPITPPGAPRGLVPHLTSPRAPCCPVLKDILCQGPILGPIPCGRFLVRWHQHSSHLQGWDAAEKPLPPGVPQLRGVKSCSR